MAPPLPPPVAAAAAAERCRPAGPLLAGHWHALAPARRRAPSAAQRSAGVRCGAVPGGAVPPPPPPGAVEELPRAMAAGYRAVQNPQRARKTYDAALQAFVASAVEAYECGYSEESVRAHLAGAAAAGELEVVAPSGAAAGAAGAGQEGEGDAEAQAVAQCWAFISLVWVTLAVSPVSVRRWATGPAVQPETLAHWESFVRMILAGYFERRMSWFPLDRLAAERAFTTGAPQKPELVAESARIVFATLDLVAPQFPKMGR